MRSRRYGERDVLVDVTSSRVAQVWGAELREIDGVIDVVPAARSLLVRCVDAATARTLARDLAHATEPAATGPAGTGQAGTGRTVTIAVVYDGEDLTAVARTLGMTRQEVIDRHTGATYRAAFAGFAPGFVYLEGLDPALETARRAQPRTRVPAGSVAIAAAMTAVYPRSSPGGWNLLGRTSALMFDLDRERPALVEPGDTVRFEAVTEAVTEAANELEPEAER